MALIAWLIYLQPRSLQMFWGRMLGALLRAKGVRRKIVEQNLKIAYPNETESFRANILKKSYDNLGYLIFELLLLFGPMDRFVRKYGVIKGAEYWSEEKAKGKGVIFISSHLGNWEIMSATGALLAGIDIMIVTKLLKPAWIHRAVERGRLRCHYYGTYEPKTLKDVFRKLNQGGTVGFVMDQYSGPPVGIRVPVFGVPVGTPAAIATLAKRTGASVLPVVNYRLPDGRFVTEIRPALEWKAAEDPNREIAENTARFAKDIEADVYSHPEQWHWVHRRFKGDLGPLRPEEWSEGRSRR